MPGSPGTGRGAGGKQRWLLVTDFGDASFALPWILVPDHETATALTLLHPGNTPWSTAKIPAGRLGGLKDEGPVPKGHGTRRLAGGRVLTTAVQGAALSAGPNRLWRHGCVFPHLAGRTG